MSNYNKVSVLIYSEDANNNRYYLLGKIRNGNVWTSLEAMPNSNDNNNPVETGARAVMEGTNNWGKGYLLNRFNNINFSQVPSRNVIPVNAGIPMPNGSIQPLKSIGMLGIPPVIMPPFLVGGSLSGNSVVLRDVVKPTNVPLVLGAPMINVPKGYEGSLGPIPKINVRLNNISQLGNPQSLNTSINSASNMSWIQNLLNSVTGTRHTVGNTTYVSFIVRKMPYDTNLPNNFLNSQLLISSRLSPYSQLAWVPASELQNLKANCTQTNRSIPSLRNDQLSNEFCQLLKNLNV